MGFDVQSVYECITDDIDESISNIGEWWENTGYPDLAKTKELIANAIAYHRKTVTQSEQYTWTLGRSIGEIAQVLMAGIEYFLSDTGE